MTKYFLNYTAKLKTLACIGIMGFSVTSYAEDLGTIRVESSTIDDRFENKRQEPSNIGAISGDEVDAAHSENIQQLLQSIPGITTELQSGDSLKIHIRGVENQVFMGEKPGVAVVIDGVPVFERTGRVNIDLDNIESIRVIKGGASYLFGEDALSGAVIITTKRGAKYAGYKLAAEAGSFGYDKELARAGFSGDETNGHIQISHRQTDGYYDDSSSESDYLNGKLQYYVDDSSDVTFGFELSDRKKNSHGTVTGVTAAEIDPKSENIIDYNDYSNRYNVDLQKLFATYSKDVGANDNLMVNLYQFTDATEYYSAPLDADPTQYTSFNDYDQQQQGLKTEYRSSGNKIAWMLAADLRDNTYENRVTTLDCSEASYLCPAGSLSSDNITDETVTAAYGEIKYLFTNDLSVTMNVRHDSIELDYSDYLDNTNNGDKTFDETSWRIGGNYALKENLDVYANLSTGFRTPTVNQLFTGSNSPTSRTAANPDLTTETSLNQEIGLRSKMNWGVPVELDAAIFQLDRDDYIQASAGQYTTSSDSTYENVGNVRNRGLELSLRTDRTQKHALELAYTYLDASYTDYPEFNLQTAPIAGSCPPGSTAVTGWGGIVTNCLTTYDNTGNTVPRTPTHHANIYLRSRLAANWLLTTELDYNSSYYVDEINQEKIDGHTVVNLLANYERKQGNYAWSFFARIDNLFDEDYYNTARGYRDSNDDGIYDEEDLSIVVNQGITFTAGAGVQF